MEIDVLLGTLLILLGAQISYVLDEVFGFTPRISAWFDENL
jgi:hypothetical protein